MKSRKRIPPRRLELLRSLPFLRGCSDRDLERIDLLVDEVSVEAGTTLVSEGDPADQAFVIVEGWAAVEVRGEPVAALGPGQFVGELAMLDRGRRSATVVAKTPMRLLVVGPAAFRDFAGIHAVANGITKALADRLRAADERLGSVHRVEAQRAR